MRGREQERHECCRLPPHRRGPAAPVCRLTRRRALFIAASFSASKRNTKRKWPTEGPPLQQVALHVRGLSRPRRVDGPRGGHESGHRRASRGRHACAAPGARVRARWARQPNGPQRPPATCASGHAPQAAWSGTRLSRLAMSRTMSTSAWRRGIQASHGTSAARRKSRRAFASAACMPKTSASSSAARRHPAPARFRTGRRAPPTFPRPPRAQGRPGARPRRVGPPSPDAGGGEARPGQAPRRRRQHLACTRVPTVGNGFDDATTLAPPSEQSTSAPPRDAAAAKSCGTGSGSVCGTAKNPVVPARAVLRPRPRPAAAMLLSPISVRNASRTVRVTPAISAAAYMQRARTRHTSAHGDSGGKPWAGVATRLFQDALLLCVPAVLHGLNGRGNRSVRGLAPGHIHFHDAARGRGMSACHECGWAARPPASPSPRMLGRPKRRAGP